MIGVKGELQVRTLKMKSDLLPCVFGVFQKSIKLLNADPKILPEVGE